MYKSAWISLEDVFRSLMLNMSLQRTKKWEHLSMQFCGMCIWKITALPPKRDRLGGKKPEASNFVRWQVRYPVFKMWAHIFQTLVWFHGNVYQLKSFWWKGGRKVYNNMVASTDSPLISCSHLKDKVLLVAVRVAGERPNPTRDPNLTSQPCYGVLRIQKKYAKSWWSTSENMKGNWKILVTFVYHGQMDGQLGVWPETVLTGQKRRRSRQLAQHGADISKCIFWGYLTWNIERFWQKKSKLLFSQVQNEPKPQFKG